MDSTKRTARVAGVLWFLMALAGGFGLGYIRNYVIVPGDAAASAGNIVASETMFRLAITSTLIGQVLYFFFALQLFRLFRNTHNWLPIVLLASIMMTVVTSVANQLNNFGALYILSGAEFLKVFSPEQLNAMAMVYLRQANGPGQGLLEIFWVPYHIAFGLLVIRSGYFPKILGILLMLAGAGFAVNLLDKFIMPAFYPAAFTTTAMALSALSVFPTMLWLLIKGVKTPKMA